MGGSAASVSAGRFVETVVHDSKSVVVSIKYPAPAAPLTRNVTRSLLTAPTAIERGNASAERSAPSATTKTATRIKAFVVIKYFILTAREISWRRQHGRT